MHHQARQVDEKETTVAVENIQQKEGVECCPRYHGPALYRLPFDFEKRGPVFEHKTPDRSILGAVGLMV
jgi:hypothetical protein